MKDFSRILKKILLVIGVLAAIAAVAYAVCEFLNRKKKAEFDDSMPRPVEDDEEFPEVDLDDVPERAAQEPTQTLEEAIESAKEPQEEISVTDAAVAETAIEETVVKEAELQPIELDDAFLDDGEDKKD